MIKIYKSKEKWSLQEDKTRKASYSTLVNNYIDSLILCNNILELDTELYDNIEVGKIEEDTDIYQAYITDLNSWQIERMQKDLGDTDDIIIAYSQMLDCYILLVDHLGTSWDYVNTSFELTDNIEEI